MQRTAAKFTRFWDAVNTENKQYLHQHLQPSLYQDMIAGLVVNGIDTWAKYRLWDTTYTLDDGADCICIVNMCDCCDFIVAHVKNPIVGLRLLFLIRTFFYQHKNALLAFDIPTQFTKRWGPKSKNEWFYIQSFCHYFHPNFSSKFATHQTWYRKRERKFQDRFL